VAFYWRFEQVEEERTRMKQRLELSGSRAQGIVGQAKFMEQSVPAGMKKLADGMERAWKKKETS